MKRIGVGAVIGILLIVVGVLFLLDTLDILPMAGYIWPALFGISGLVFLLIFLSNRALNWWAIIPALALLGLGALIVLGQLAPLVGETWGPAVFLAALGLSFFVIYLVHRQHWWALIPFGALLTVAVVVLVAEALPGQAVAGVLFLGLALTFGALYFVRTPEGRLKWALVPALVLLAVGLLVAVASGAVATFVWAISLILVGLYLLYRALFRRSD